MTEEIKAKDAEEKVQKKPHKRFIEFIKVGIDVTFWIFILFVMIMFIVWSAPKIWRWAVG
jgi:hypothetical protein